MMDAMMDGIIAARINRGPSTPPDVLDTLIAAHNPDRGTGLTPLELRNNLLGFPHRRPRNHRLGIDLGALPARLRPRRPAQGARVARDVIGDRPATAEDIPRLQYIRQIIEEAMRLYPPGALMTRTARDHDQLGDRRVRPGQTIILPIYALHRHSGALGRTGPVPAGTLCAGTFSDRHRYSYLPFSAGPRICIGMSFAMMEMIIVLATYRQARRLAG
jgi:cytochrome P450